MGTRNMGRGTGSPAAAAGPFSILLLIKARFYHFSMLIRYKYTQYCQCGVRCHKPILILLNFLLCLAYVSSVMRHLRRASSNLS